MGPQQNSTRATALDTIVQIAGFILYFGWLKISLHLCILLVEDLYTPPCNLVSKSADISEFFLNLSTDTIGFAVVEGKPPKISLLQLFTSLSSASNNLHSTFCL